MVDRLFIFWCHETLPGLCNGHVSGVCDMFSSEWIHSIRKNKINKQKVDHWNACLVLHRFSPFIYLVHNILFLVVRTPYAVQYQTILYFSRLHKYAAKYKFIIQIEASQSIILRLEVCPRMLKDASKWSLCFIWGLVSWEPTTVPSNSFLFLCYDCDRLATCKGCNWPLSYIQLGLASASL